MRWATETADIEAGDKFISRSGGNIAVVTYLSVNGDVGYRIKWSRRIRHSTSKNFRRNYMPLSEYEAASDPASNGKKAGAA